MDRKLIPLAILVFGALFSAPSAKMLKTIVDFGGPRVNCGNTTWNPSDKNASITLSNGNLTASQATTASTWRSVRATSSRTTGKLYWEVTVNSVDTSGGWITGLANATQVLTNYSGSSTNSVGCQFGGGSSGSYYYNGSGSADTCGYNSGGCIGPLQIADDLGGNLWWSRWSGGGGTCGQWNNSGTADPATAAGGLSLHIAGGAVAVFPSFSGFFASSTADTATINTGCSAFTGAVPSGFTAWH